MLMLIAGILVSLAASSFGFRWARNFVHGRLRYVDAAQNRLAPVAAGVLAGIAVLPITWLPLIGSLITVGTAVVFGIGVGLGVASASRDIRLASYRMDRW